MRTIDQKPSITTLHIMLYLICVSLILSFNFHQLWLLYDISLVVVAGLLFVLGEFKLKFYEWWLLFLVVFFFVLRALYSENFSYSLLSAWDVTKHFFLLMLLRVFLRNPTMLESENYNFSKFILVVFFVQAAMIFWQNYDGIYYDDISGTFGEGASHSIGYMSLLTIAVAITMPFNTLVKGLVILLSFVINMMSSNVGFYVLITFFLFAYYIRIQISIRSLSFLLLLVLATTALFNISLYARYSFGEFIVRRIAGVFVDPTIYDSEGKMGRPQALVYAWDLGGWFGAGSGAFSNIYQMQGYKSDTLANGRINISEFTHLLAENGLLGLLLVTSFYALMFSAMFDGVYHKLVTMVLIPFCFLYSTALTTETQFLLLSLTFYYVSKMKKPGFRPNRISSQS